MTWNECLDCHRVYSTRDGVETCPCCGSEYVAELYTCELCQGPVMESGTKFCKSCREFIDQRFKKLFEEAFDVGEVEEGKIPEIVFDRAEEVDFYG